MPTLVTILIIVLILAFFRQIVGALFAIGVMIALAAFAVFTFFILVFAAIADFFQEKRRGRR